MYKLYVNMENCEFARQEVMFLGHLVGQGRVRMDPRKVDAIVDWPVPTGVSELRSFLGLANYYRKFVAGYSKKAAPLTDLLRKNERWQWGSHCQSAFEKLKATISSEP